ncbi:MAG: transposase, partial [Christensenellaceae bacterium]|nr:transposase [Christensenellaceae bacterium]
MNINKPIPIPNDKGIHIKKAGYKLECFVYKYTDYFRNAEGKPRNSAICIGKVDSQTGLMIPNKNYYLTYECVNSLNLPNSFHFGYSFIVEKIAHDIGLDECLKIAFGENRANAIMKIAAFTILNGSAIYVIEEWLETTYFESVDRPKLTSESVSTLFKNITYNERNMFFVNWISKICNEQTVCFDVTPVLTCFSDMPSVEREYNIDEENLNYFNLGVFCNENDRMPLYYNHYDGSLTDMTNLAYILENAAEVNLINIKFVLDGGFKTEVYYKALKKMCKCFVIGLSSKSKAAIEVLNNYSNTIMSYKNKLVKHNVYGISVEKKINGVSGRVFMFFDLHSYTEKTKRLNKKIEMMAEKITKIKYYSKSKLKDFEQYYAFKKHENDKGYDYELNHEVIDKEMKKNGYFFTFTNDMTTDATSVLEDYRSKDVIEKLFDLYKTEHDGYRVRTENEHTT